MTLESPLNSNMIKPVNPKENQSWIFTGMTDVEVEAPILWPLDAKSQLIRKYPDAWKVWRQEEKGLTEDEMVGCHLWLNGHEFEQSLGVGDWQGSLECCSPWGCKELDMTKLLNNYGLPILQAQDCSDWCEPWKKPSMNGTLIILGLFRCNHPLEMMETPTALIWLNSGNHSCLTRGLALSECGFGGWLSFLRCWLTHPLVF